MKKLLLMLMICCMCTACGAKEDNANVQEQPNDTVASTQTEESAKISPLPVTIDMNALDNCTLPVSFGKGDAYLDDSGILRFDVTVYTYDMYDMVEISALKEGDTIVIQGNDIVVESLETLESGLIFINGGMDNGGYDLWHDDSGVYFEHGYNDAKSYYPIGEATFRVSTEFEFTDITEQGETVYYPGDFLMEYAGFAWSFDPNSTSIVVADGQVVAMTKTAF